MTEKLTTVRVKESTRKSLNIDKQTLGLKSIDELIILYRNTHYLHNIEHKEKKNV